MASKKKLHTVMEAGNGSGTDEFTKAVVITPVLTLLERRQEEDNSGPQPTMSPEARLEEAIGLAGAIDLQIVHSEIVTVSKIRASTLIGSGKIDEISAIVNELGVEVVIIDHQLTPVQQRNLERHLKAKVIDRTGLILEIFGRRARTKEGRLQVDLAHLEYQRSRLVRSWTHLAQQRGGGAFMGGPGETQVESDRRLLQEKVLRIKRELETVRRTRDLQRSKRRKAPFPVVSIVGYTNAGKSTLFNRLTGAEVLAEDMLFATLDPTLRRIRLPHGTIAILSDTVGFISDLPTTLVAAFRATLEEVVEADLILHLRDISNPDTNAHAREVEEVLESLGLDPTDDTRLLEVWNKVDQLDPNNRELLLREEVNRRAPIAISAISGEGIADLLSLIEERLSGELMEITVTLLNHQLANLDWLYQNSRVLNRKNLEDGSVSLTMKVTDTARNEIIRRLGPSVK